jgi:hypothetical protein
MSGLGSASGSLFHFLALRFDLAPHPTSKMPLKPRAVLFGSAEVCEGLGAGLYPVSILPALDPNHTHPPNRRRPE